MKLLISDEKQAVTEELLAALTRSADAAVRAEGIPDDASASVIFVNDKEIRDLNREHRGIDRSTDVLSFPNIGYPDGKTAGKCPELLMQAYDDAEGSAFLGDIVISTEHAEAQAKEFGHSVIREYAYLLTHGLFHLMGYDHLTDEDRAVMRSMEEKALSDAGIRRETDNG